MAVLCVSSSEKFSSSLSLLVDEFSSLPKILTSEESSSVRLLESLMAQLDFGVASGSGEGSLVDSLRSLSVGCDFEMGCSGVLGLVWTAGKV